MLYTIGFDEIIRNFFVLSKKFTPKTIETTDDLQEAYHLFLKDFQPTVPFSSDLIVLDDKKEEELVRHFLKPSILKDRGEECAASRPLTLFEKEAKKKYVQECLEDLKNLNDDYSEIFNLAIHSLFFRESEKSIGGSVASAMGVIWVNVKKDWNKVDTIEFLIHELIHNLIFIDEFRYGHYRHYPDLKKPENLVPSAILKQDRPLDKTFHSILVCIELLWCRLTFLPPLQEPKVHFKNPRLLEKAEHALQAVRKLPNLKDLFTERGLFLFERCEDLFYKGKAELERSAKKEPAVSSML